MEIFETHIALRVESFQGALEKLHAAGYHEDLPDEHPLKMVIKRESPTGYPQVYFLDPDGHLLSGTPRGWINRSSSFSGSIFLAACDGFLIVRDFDLGKAAGCRRADGGDDLSHTPLDKA